MDNKDGCPGPVDFWLVRLKKLLRGGKSGIIILMHKNALKLFISVAILVVIGCSAFSCNPLQGDIKVISGGKNADQPTEQTQPPVSFASPPTAQSNNPVERQITITESNSVFSIGLPAGYREERSVTAQKPIDFWFEYLTSDMALEVNGQPVEIPVRGAAAKLGYTTNVYNFSYVLRNLSTQPLSYNLHMVPSKAGDTVPAVTQEKWIAP